MLGRLLLSALLSIYALCTSLIVQADSKPLVFAYQDSDNFPFQTGSGHQVPSNNPGIAVEQVQRMAKRLQLTIKLIRVPWKRGLKLLQQGEIDGLFSASYKKKRIVYGLYPTDADGNLDKQKHSYANAYTLFRHKNHPIRWDGQHFNRQNYLLYAPLGFSIVDDLRKKGMQVEETRSILAKLKQINQGRGDGIVLLSHSGYGFLSRYTNELSNLIAAKPDIVRKAYYLMLSHQYVADQPQQADRIWQTLAEIRQSNDFKARYLNYMNQSVETSN